MPRQDILPLHTIMPLIKQLEKLPLSPALTFQQALYLVRNHVAPPDQDGRMYLDRLMEDLHLVHNLSLAALKEFYRRMLRYENNMRVRLCLSQMWRVRIFGEDAANEEVLRRNLRSLSHRRALRNMPPRMPTQSVPRVTSHIAPELPDQAPNRLRPVIQKPSLHRPPHPPAPTATDIRIAVQPPAPPRPPVLVQAESSRGIRDIEPAEAIPEAPTEISLPRPPAPQPESDSTHARDLNPNTALAILNVESALQMYPPPSYLSGAALKTRDLHPSPERQTRTKESRQPQPMPSYLSGTALKTRDLHPSTSKPIRAKSTPPTPSAHTQDAQQLSLSQPMTITYDDLSGPTQPDLASVPVLPLPEPSVVLLESEQASEPKADHVQLLSPSMVGNFCVASAEYHAWPSSEGLPSCPSIPEWSEKQQDDARHASGTFSSCTDLPSGQLAEPTALTSQKVSSPQETLACDDTPIQNEPQRARIKWMPWKPMSSV